MRDGERVCERYQRAAGLLGKRWTGVILKVLLGGPLRFSEIAGLVEPVSDRVLSERLKELEAEGVVERRAGGCAPARVDYALTEKGRALAPVLEAIERWSQDWIDPAPAERERE